MNFWCPVGFFLVNTRFFSKNWGCFGSIFLGVVVVRIGFFLVILGGLFDRVRGVLLCAPLVPPIAADTACCLQDGVAARRQSKRMDHK